MKRFGFFFYNYYKYKRKNKSRRNQKRQIRIERNKKQKMNFFKFYCDQIATNPLRTKMITAGCTYALGDFIAQKYIEQKEDYNYKRTIKSAVFGSLFAAPLLHQWYNFVPGFSEKFIFSKFSNLSQFSKVTITMILDQTTFSVFFNAYFYVIINLIEYQSLQKGILSIKDKLGDTMINCWKLWPLAQMINFCFVPLQFRVLFGNCVGVFWNIYLSYMQHKSLNYNKPQKQLIPLHQ